MKKALMVWFLVFLCAIFIQPKSVFAVQAANAMVHAALQENMEAAIEGEALVGVVWATVTSDKIEIGKAGLADAKQGKPLSIDSKVQTGSVTKTLIAAGILQLVTEERLELDAPVTSLLPNIQFENPWASSSPVLVRHLLDHTSGLDDARLWQMFSLNAQPDAPLSKSIQPGHLKVRNKPGMRLSYSNLGYTLLGMVIEQVTGEPYERYLDAHLLHPLGMLDSTFQFTSQEGKYFDAQLAMGHFEGGVTQSAVPLYLRPAGQFTTTAADMGRFARFLMSNGEVGGEVFIEPELLRAMGRPTTTEVALVGLVDAGYGLGLNSRDRHGVVGNCHTGTTVGFRANFCLFPQEQKAFFVAMNADVEAADYKRFDAALIQELDVATVTPAKRLSPLQKVADWQGVYVLSPNRTESFVYLDRLLNFATVQWDGQQLHLQPFQGAEQSLIPVGGQFFRSDDRVKASHALLVSGASQQVISDGFRSYEKSSLWLMVPLWGSLFAGLIGLCYLILFGMIRILRRRLNKAAPLFVPFLASVCLFIPIPFFFNQSFLQLGDLTFASGLLALVTGILPLAMLFGLWRSLASSEKGRRISMDALAMLGVLQWSMVLFFWGLLPLRLWV